MNKYLRIRAMLVLLSALGLGRLSATPACPIITQNFSGSATGATIDTTATGWYIDASALVNPTYFAVRSNRFTAENIGGEGVWYSRIFPVTGYSSFQVAVKITAEGQQTSSEYVKIYYKVDGGPETLLDQRTGNFGTIDFTSAALTGSTVQLVVRIYDYNNGSGQSSKYYIEQYRVFKEVSPCTPAAIPVSATIGSALKTITCTNASVTLAASSTASGVTYKWTGPAGFSSTSASPVVSAPGTYEVIGTSAAGSGAAVVTVAASNTPPDLVASGAALGCSASVTLSAASSVSGVSYQWTGPNSFSSTSPSPSVSALGAYTVTVTNPANGCSASQSVQVVSGSGTASTFWNEDFTLPDSTKADNGATSWSIVNTTGGVFAVINNEFKVNNLGNATVGTWTSGVINISGRTSVNVSVDVRSGVSSGGALENSGSSVDSISLFYILDGGAPVQFSSNLGTINSNRSTDTTIRVGSLSGSTLQVMVRARTTSSDEFYYFDNVKVSGILQTTVTAGAANNGPITCRPDSVTLLGSSGTAGVSFAWTGPNGFSSTLQNPKVRNTGTYNVAVTNSGGCSASASTTITEDISIPADVSAFVSDQLTCNVTTVNLTGSSSTTGATYNWTGPNGFSAATAATSTTAPGSYSFQATNPANGCSKTIPVNVSQNIAAPANVTATNDGPLTCDMTEVTLTGSSTSPNVEYEWDGPDGYLSFSAQDIATEAGDYVLTVTNDDNGCTIKDTTTVFFNCPSERRITTQPATADSSQSPSGDFEFKAWPNPFSHQAFVGFRLPAPGFVTLQVYNSNGIAEKLLFNNKAIAGQEYKISLGTDLPAGVHYVTIRVNNKAYTKKMISVR